MMDKPCLQVGLNPTSHVLILTTECGGILKVVHQEAELVFA